MKAILAGPWIGEFGWELCWWNPMLRRLCEDREVAVAAPLGSRYLYEFAAQFIPLKIEGQAYHKGLLLEGVLPPREEFKVIDPSKMWEKWGHEEYSAVNEGRESDVPKKWRKLVPAPSYVADILCAFRPEKIVNGKKNPGKEYPRQNCARVVEMLIESGFTVACYGGRDNHYFEGTIDLRGAPLNHQCAALGGALCAVGPSSGTMHLASLCGCPHVTWTAVPGKHIYRRYFDTWNPFETPLDYIKESYPAPEKIVRATRGLAKI